MIQGYKEIIATNHPTVNQWNFKAFQKSYDVMKPCLLKLCGFGRLIVLTGLVIRIQSSMKHCWKAAITTVNTCTVVSFIVF